MTGSPTVMIVCADFASSGARRLSPPLYRCYIANIGIKMLSRPEREVADARLRSLVPGGKWFGDRRYARKMQRSAEDKRRSDEQLLAAVAARNRLLLNVGSSDNVLQGWVNLDIAPGEGILPMDATRPWPFRDGSAAAVNSEHLIEHLSRDQALTFLTEAFRVLEPSGSVRISTPDLEGLVQAYLARDPSALTTHVSHGYSALTFGDMVNNYFYNWDHLRIWDFETLSRVLAGVGFEDVQHASFNSSKHSVLDGIDMHDPGSLATMILCVDARKPSGS